jgi:hypothetical protein
MLWQIRICPRRQHPAGPIPARPGLAPSPDFHPPIVNDGQADRHLTQDRAIEQRIPDDALQA